MGHRWTQINFVQQQPHWVQDTTLTSTAVLGLPVDCVLAGQQTIRDRYWQFEVVPPRIRVTASPLARRGRVPPPRGFD